jgi:hypothetical protein
MQREIFGPILPVLPYDTLDEVIGRVNAGPRPLAIYPFSNRRECIDRLTFSKLRPVFRQSRGWRAARASPKWPSRRFSPRSKRRERDIASGGPA